MRRSLQLRLLLGVVSAMVVLLAVVSASVYVGFRQTLFTQFDGILRAMVEVLAVSVELDGDQVDVELEVQRMAEFNNPGLPMNYQLWRQDGTAVAKSPLLGLADLAFPLNPGPAVRFDSLDGPAGSVIRVASCLVYPKIEDTTQNQEEDKADLVIASDDQALVLAVSRDLTEVYHTLGALGRLLITTAVIAVVLSIGIGWAIVRQGLKPLKTIAAQIGTIGERDLSARITDRCIPTEIVPIQIRLNDLLERLEKAFQRERRFTADAAHELRTPLAGLRSILEVCLSRSRASEEYRRALCDSLTVSCDMQVMVDNLLTLSRLEDPSQDLCMESIRLHEAVETCWKPFADQALEKGLTCRNRVDDKLILCSNPALVSMILKNGLSNAVAYTPAGGSIKIEAAQSDQTLEIRILNSGCTLTSKDLTQCFDPFWRADTSRSAEGNHCGLGLVLVKRITEVLGGRVCATVNSYHEFCLTLTFSLERT